MIPSSTTASLLSISSPYKVQRNNCNYRAGNTTSNNNNNNNNSSTAASPNISLSTTNTATVSTSITTTDNTTKNLLSLKHQLQQYQSKILASSPSSVQLQRNNTSCNIASSTNSTMFPLNTTTTNNNSNNNTSNTANSNTSSISTRINTNNDALNDPKMILNNNSNYDNSRNRQQQQQTTMKATTSTTSMNQRRCSGNHNYYSSRGGSNSSYNKHVQDMIDMEQQQRQRENNNNNNTTASVHYNDRNDFVMIAHNHNSSNANIRDSILFDDNNIDIIHHNHDGIMYDNDDDDDDDEEDNEEPHNIKVCLHCKVEKVLKSDIQVRCDECTAYICENCHWCHEYQANHEIRVCDRCDGFYCRNCDEMDQCDDCNEVVCSSCSTLLSCKFCGGGLCEDCATACGRCGIVLCSRDSKFAVECDTCKLSYCLVCLASGSKDACVRCGSRPSKRMEQLVHLRLKSIYKAFKQNTAASASFHMNGKNHNMKNHNMPPPSGSRSGGRNHPQRLNDDFYFDDVDDPEILFQATKLSAAAAAASSMYNMSASSSKNLSNKSSLANRMIRNDNNTNASSAVDRATRFKEEKEKADAAAAALLAELEEEEEENVKSKNKKKKKKKAKQPLNASIKSVSSKIADKNSSNIDLAGRDKVEFIDEEYDEEGEEDGYSTEHISYLLPSYSKGDSKPAAKIYHEKNDSVDDQQVPDDEVVDESDQLEKELFNLVSAEDIVGLENLMESIKGIPGRAALRKNAKKALKKLRLANAPEVQLPIDAEKNLSKLSPTLLHSPKVIIRSSTPEIQTPVTQSDPNGYLQIISLVHNKPASLCATPGSQHTNTAQARSRSNTLSSSNSSGPLKSECTMHVKPLIVGWMIGKGGQRIRDLMEESGARIWIDQDSMGANDPRILYISGSRKNVGIAVGLLQELVLKYQPLPSPHTRLTSTPHSDKAITAAPAGKGPSLPETSEGPAVQLKPKAGPATANLTPAANITVGDGRSKHVLSCDPRFVPLLIGRRGWTIKNIQDTTGAKVDIDQNTTPRKITISGLEDNVDKAVRMVQDVLSYPHSQLHGFTGDDSHINDSDIIPAIQEELVRQGTSVLDNSLMHDEHRNITSSVEIIADRPVSLSGNASASKLTDHLPPSSLIMTGDARSTISASSSLSSTPELVMPAAPLAQFPPIDLGTTTLTPQQQNRDVFPPTLNGWQQGSYNHISSESPLPHTSVFQQQMYGSLDQNYQQIPLVHQQQTPIPLHQYSPNQLDRPTFLPDQTSAFYSVHGQPQLPLQNLVGASQLPSTLFSIGNTERLNNFRDSLRQNDPSLSTIDPGLWNGIGASQETSMLDSIGPESHRRSIDDFQLHAAVDFLEHSKQLHTKPTTLINDINDVLGFSHVTAGLDQAIGVVSDPLLHFPKGRDDAQMVDSLFGPSTSTAAAVVGDNLLPGLNGLSLHHHEERASGLWGADDPIIGASSIRKSNEEVLLSGLAPQKTESRFVWE